MVTTKSAASQDVLLNLVRVISAFSVAIWHFQLLIPKSNSNRYLINDYPFHRVLGFLYTHGFLAVQLFWAISGFVIAKAYLNKMWEPIRFIRNRFARLYPLHLTTFLIVAILQFAIRDSQGRYAICTHQDSYHFLLNLFFIPAIGLEKGCSFNAPIWSVSVELISYLAFAVLLTLGGKINLFKLIVINFLTLLFLVFNPINLPTHILDVWILFLLWHNTLQDTFNQLKISKLRNTSYSFFHISKNGENTSWKFRYEGVFHSLSISLRDDSGASRLGQ
jgi:peptidoglycan/LPS O-acetylase OafA/YrhL